MNLQVANVMCCLSFIRSVLLCSAIGVLAFEPQSSRGADRFERLDDYIHAALQTWEVPGLAIAVVHNGEVVLARGYGVQQIGGDVPVTTETVFPIASCTKSFTASAIALLVDEGTLHWDDPVRKHLPEFRVADPYVTEHVTVRDLLCHRTGLVRGDLIGMSGGFTHAEMMRQLQYLPQAAPFRSRVTYSSVMFAMLGEVIERKTGVSWEEFVTRRLLEPLEMKSTATDRQTVSADRLALRHRIYDGEIALLRTPDSDRMAAAGAMHSTIGDMANWLAFQLQEGEFRGKRLLSKSTIREMHAVQQSIPVKWRPTSDAYDARFAGTGLGWFIRDFRGRKVVQHGGAWGAEIALVPEEKLGIVVLSNRDLNGLVWMLIFDVIDAFAVGPEQAWDRGEKWERWLKIGGPATWDRDLKEERAVLEKNRKPLTQPSLPLAQYAGDYESTLYPDLRVAVVDERLHVRFGDYTARLDHWEQDNFYGRAVIEPYFDWLVKFDVDEGALDVAGLEIVHVGWKDPDERFIFRRSRKP